MRRLALLAHAALIVPLAAWGQVAAPSLVPAVSGVVDPSAPGDPSFVPINPAVLGWASRSMVGFGVIRSELHHHKAGISNPLNLAGVDKTTQGGSAQFEGSYAGGRYSAERFSVAVEMLDVQNVSGPDPRDDQKQAAGAALRFGETWTAGAGYHNEASETDGSKGKTSGGAVGATWRLLPRLYLGAIAGVDDVSNKGKGSSIAALDVSGSRTSYGLGVGYLSDGPVKLHFELWAASLGSVNDKSVSNWGGGTVQTAIAEARFANWVFGYSGAVARFKIETDVFDVQATAVTHDLIAGVADEKGFTVLLHHGIGTQTQTQKFTLYQIKSTPTDDSRTRAVSLAWQF